MSIGELNWKFMLIELTRASYWYPDKKRLRKISSTTSLPLVDVWNLHLQGNDQSLHLHINSCTANQELKLLESHWTAVSRAEEWKTCKRMKANRNWPRLGAGQRGSDAFVNIDSQKNLECQFLYRKSTVHTWGEEREKAFYTFWSRHVAF